MILKNRANNIEKNPLKKQGDSGEDRMAHSLCRYFQNTPDVFVFNDIYMDFEGNRFQIDHLLLLPHGFILIESKSCLGEISYNKYDEWKRKTKTIQQGFRSPIQQLKEQELLLGRLLDKNATQLLDKFLFGKVQARFGGRFFDKYV